MVAIAALDRKQAAPVASILLSEICRAKIVDDRDMPACVVRMHSDVEIRENMSYATRWIHLVYPGEADADPDAVSVLSMLGTALVGLAKGDSIDWCTVTGDRRSVSVVRICPR